MKSLSHWDVFYGKTTMQIPKFSVPPFRFQSTMDTFSIWLYPLLNVGGFHPLDNIHAGHTTKPTFQTVTWANTVPTTLHNFATFCCPLALDPLVTHLCEDIHHNPGTLAPWGEAVFNNFHTCRPFSSSLRFPYPFPRW